jgi:hypothetical protein
MYLHIQVPSTLPNTVPALSENAGIARHPGVVLAAQHEATTHDWQFANMQGGPLLSMRGAASGGRGRLGGQSANLHRLHCTCVLQRGLSLSFLLFIYTGWRS